jgi:dihydrolipoamide dehydrogenase
VGGGAVGCEFACLLQAAGSQVTIVEMTAGLLPGEDAAVVSALTRSFESRGIKIKTNVKVTEVKKSSTGWSLKLSDGEFLESSDLLLCAGRYANLKSLALDKAGIKFEKNILVNEKLQTSNSAVYAAGDAAGTRLAHAASQQAEAAVTNALGGSKILDDRFIPRCLYSWPEVASVGAWKYQMDEKNIPSKASRGFFQATAKALASGDTEGFVQIVFNPESRQIQGAQIIGPHATELIHVFSVALKKDCTIDDLADMVFAHPTLSEAIKEAARK